MHLLCGCLHDRLSVRPLSRMPTPSCLLGIGQLLLANKQYRELSLFSRRGQCIGCQWRQYHTRFHCLWHADRVILEAPYAAEAEICAQCDLWSWVLVSLMSATDNKAAANLLSLCSLCVTGILRIVYIAVSLHHKKNSVKGD